MENNMQAKEFKVGGSLPVPSVQELAKNNITILPPRYIRLDQEPSSHTCDDEAIGQEVPVIDMQRLLSEGSINPELDKLDHACKEWGFFQLINHGVDILLLDKVKKGIQDLFNLPMEEKKRFWQTQEELEGFGQNFVLSEGQKLDWADIFAIFTLPKHIRKSHLFPELPIPFRDTLEVYSSEMKNLSMTILIQIAKALKMDIEEMRDAFETGTQAMRMNYYPPCPEPEKAIGLTPHTDASSLTILLQLNEVEGLEIRKDGRWIPINPLPNAFVVNIGDMLEIMSNGIYRSIEHRAVVNSAKERLSIATFESGRHDGELGPAHSLISEENPALFRRVSTREYLSGVFSRKLHGRSNVEAMRIQPDSRSTS